MNAIKTKRPPQTLANVLDWLPAKLKKWRDKHKLTQDEARAHLRVSLGTYRNWEQGRKPPANQFTLDALLRRLKEPVVKNGSRAKEKTSANAATGS